MELAISDRLVLQSILPVEGDLLTARTVRELRHKLEFSAEEVAKCGIKVDGPNVSWTTSETKDIELTLPQAALILEALNKLKAEKKVRAEHIPLFDYFDANPVVKPAGG